MVESRKAGSDNPYIRYIAGRTWQCVDSPSGAHHWVYNDKDKKFHCKYCNQSKRLPLSWAEWQSKHMRKTGPPYGYPLAEDYPRHGMKDSG